MGLENNIPVKKYSLSKDIIAPFRTAYQSHKGRKLVLLPKHFEALNKIVRMPDECAGRRNVRL